MLLQLLLFAVWLLLLLVANVDDDEDDDDNVEELAVAAALADVEDKDIVAAPAIAVIADGVGDAEPLRDDEEKDLNILCLFLFNNGISVES